MIAKIIVLVFLFLLVYGCESIPYKGDLHLMPSSQANYPDLLIKINGMVCKNVQGDIGVCFLKIRRSVDLIVNIPSLPYNYTFVSDCTDFINSDESYSVSSKTELNHVIPSHRFDHATAFNCTFAIVKGDNISFFASSRFYVFSDKFEEVSRIYPIEIKDKKYLILGENAYRAFTGNKTYSRRTSIPYQEGVIVETEVGRRAYYGY